jgi:hypothetical protein
LTHVNLLELRKQLWGASSRLALFIFAAAVTVLAWNSAAIDTAVAQGDLQQLLSSPPTANADSMLSSSLIGQTKITAVATVQIGAKVAGSRMIVVDAAGGIKAIYSNTPDPEAPVSLRLGGMTGPAPQDATTTLEHYRRLEPKIDWRKFGLVYSQP